MITGHLLAGPVCPVETDPPDPFCSPAPVAGALVTVVGADGVEIETTSDDEGFFKIQVPPEDVTIRFGDVPGLMGTPADVTARVLEDQTLNLGDIFYDTGIR